MNCTVSKKSASGKIRSRYIATPDGIRFRSQPEAYAVRQVREYWFSDIRPDDVVVDIGANMGAFCIRAAKMARKVFAAEPVTVNDLRENIRLNGADIEVLDGALGSGGVQPIEWDGVLVMKQTYPLREIREMAGGCDFLKCDCEGAEWSIIPEDLQSVRRIEMELHMPPICGPINRRLLDYISAHYRFVIDRLPCHAVMGVMGVLHAERIRPQ
ncbi:MAG: FkbM family methyltransferase [Methanomicrobiaceae archaeon]|nr:FkbM family methyltransferase [Methanomicrobiaceae archaeon]